MANKINSKKETKPIVVIIGGGNGIGKASAILMAKMGWRVAVADIDKNPSDKVAIKINSESYYIDVKDEESLETASKRIENEMGPVRSLVVCAAIFQDIKPSEKLDYNEWNNIINISAITRKASRFLTLKCAITQPLVIYFCLVSCHRVYRPCL